MNKLLDLRCQIILAIFGGPDQWTDWEAILLCPIEWLPAGLRDGRYLAAKGRHAGTVLEGMGQVIRSRHCE